MLNCNKRSITLNTKTPDGKAIFEKLIEHCDVLVENFGPGVLDRQGFTWDRIREINPRISYASIKGFGPGKFEDFKAYETVAQAMGGGMSTTGWPDGPPTSTGAADRRLGQRHPHGRRDPRRAVPAHAHRARPARDGRDAGQRAQPDPREDARPAAAGARTAARVPEQDVLGLRAALGQRVGRRPAGPGAQVRAGRRERLRVRDHPAASVGAAREADRPPGARRRSGVRDAGGAAAAPRRSVRAWSKSGRRR